MVPTLKQLAIDQNVKNILSAPPLIKEMIIDTTISSIKSAIYFEATRDINTMLHTELRHMKFLVPEIIGDLLVNIDRDYYKKYPSISRTTINYARDAALIYLGTMEH